MIKFIFYVLFFYFIYRIIKFFIRFMSGSGTNTQGNRSKSRNSKYSDVEEAKYIEIETDSKKQTDNNTSEKQ